MRPHHVIAKINEAVYSIPVQCPSPVVEVPQFHMPRVGEMARLEEEQIFRPIKVRICFLHFSNPVQSPVRSIWRVFRKCAIEIVSDEVLAASGLRLKHTWLNVAESLRDDGICGWTVILLKYVDNVRQTRLHI